MKTCEWYQNLSKEEKETIWPRMLQKSLSKLVEYRRKYHRMTKNTSL